MSSITLNNPGSISFKSILAGREISESRLTIGKLTQPTITTGFAEVFNSNSEVNFNIQYQSTENGSIKSDDADQNLTYGIIELPEGNVFKHFNNINLIFDKSEVWNTLDNFELNINYNGQKEGLFLFLYTVSFPMTNPATIQLRMNYNCNSIYETTTHSGPSDIVGLHSGIVMKVDPGNSILKLEYKYDGDKIVLQDLLDNRYSQSMIAFKLPDDTKIISKKLESTINLNTNNDWKSFYLGSTFEVTKPKQTILFVYTINLNIDKKNFYSRLRIGSKYSKRSVISGGNTEYISGQGYSIKILPKGSYSVDIDYKTNSDKLFSFESSRMDGQGVNLQIILLD